MLFNVGIDRGQTTSTENATLSSCFPMLLGLVPRVKKDKKLREMMHKLAHLIEQVPFCMMKSGKALREWVDELVPVKLLDVDYCKAVLQRPRAVLPQPASGSLQVQAMGLEPDMAQVVVTGRGAQESAETQNPKTVLWCSIAYDLVKAGTHNWSDALAVADLCCSRLQCNLAVDPPPEEAEVDEPLLDLDDAVEF